MQQVIEFFQKLFGTESWPPRWVCGKWTDFHGWLYICSDLAIWVAYFTIPAFLFYLLRKKKDIPLPLVFWMFMAFIILCGTTHLVDALMFWWPAYRLNGLVRFITALVSWITVYMLARILPDALNLKTSADYNAELLKQNNKLTEYTKELEQRNKEAEQFAYVASHDLQEPLGTVNNFTGLLANEYKDKLDDEGKKYLTYIVEGGKRMQALVHDLLQYSRVNKVQKPFEKVDINIAVKVALDNLHHAIQDSKAQVAFHNLPVVMGDELQMVQLFQNLIGNAVKFRGKEVPRIDITSEKRNNEYLFSVKDNGIGIEQQYFEKIFVIFQRLHTRSEYEGTGIGLSICQRITELHGGKIWVESQLGKGSTFYFTIKN